MARFYGQVFGQASTEASRRGSRNIKVSAQSWNGSVITTLYYNENDDLMVNIEISDGSSSYGHTHFDGSLEELKERLKGGK
jgi:hypothetical protein